MKDVTFIGTNVLEEPEKEAWVFTFGQNHITQFGVSLGNRYVVIEGDIQETRDKMFEVRGPKWSMQYPLNEAVLEDPNGRWSTKQIGLEEVELVEFTGKPMKMV